MTKILGLDLGTNSIGWAVVDKENRKIDDCGVKIFPEGVENVGQGEREQSNNATRRENRQKRRQYYRVRLRKIKLLEVLIEQGMCPLTVEELKLWKNWNKTLKSNGRQFPKSPEFSEWLKLDPYYLRFKALNENINPYEFGRILYHFIQRRGFVSSRKGKEDGTIYKGKDNMSGVDETKNLINSNTLGKSLYEIKPKDNVSYYKIFDENGKELRVRGRYTLRDMYIEEFDKIWEKQSINLKLNSKNILVKKVRFLKDSAIGKRSKSKIEHLKQSKGDDQVIVDGKKITTIDYKNFKEYLAGKIWYENGKIKFKSNESVLFWQRPLRTQKFLLSKCTFEGRKFYDKNINKWFYIGPSPILISHPDFELYRAYQFVNNITYGVKQNLDSEQKDLVIEFINKKEKDFDFAEIPKLLGLQSERFNFEDDYKVKGNPTIKQLKSFFSNEIWEKKYHEIWHCFHFYDDSDMLVEKLIKSYGLDENLSDKVKKVRLSEDYSNISLKAIHNILPFLKLGYKLSEAIILGGVRNAFGERWERFKSSHDEIINNVIKINRDKKNKEGEAVERIKIMLSDKLNQFGFIENDKAFRKLYHPSQQIEQKQQNDKLGNIENLRNPIVQQGLHELRRLINDLIEKYKNKGNENFYFDRINVELGRDLRNNKSKRYKIAQLNEENKKANNEAKERLAEFGLKPNRENITKYLLYKEIQSNSGNVICPYTAKSINIVDLLGTENRIQIEHIIPYSISLDDSFANKTICDANFNREKGELTPYQYYQKNGNPEIWGGAKSWKEIEHRTFKLLPYNKAKRFVSQTDFLPESFIQRQLNDTRFISKKAKEILSEICTDVRVLPGSLTSELRHLWGLNNIIQPVSDLELNDIVVDENETIPHIVIVDEYGRAVKAFPSFNLKPDGNKTHICIPGKIEKGKFNSYIFNDLIDAANYSSGKYWAMTKVVATHQYYSVFKEKPEIKENEILIKGRVQKGLFTHETLGRGLPVNVEDGSFWASFKINKTDFILANTGKKPKLKVGQLAYFGQISNGIFESNNYKCFTNFSNGNYWVILDLKLETINLFAIKYPKPLIKENQLVLQGDVNEDGEFIPEIDPDFVLRTQLAKGKFYTILEIVDDITEFYPLNAEIPKLEKGQSVIEGNVWLDKKTGEIRFDPKKNRDDHRHHAIDAIAIAFNEQSYLQKLSTYNAQLMDYRRGKNNKPTFDEPWDNFDIDVKEAVDKILVSHKQNKKVRTKISRKVNKNGKTYQSIGFSARGRLHREFYFGKHPRVLPDGGFETNKKGEIEYYYHIRKSITSIENSKHVEKIVDDGIKKIIEKRLTEVYNIDISKPYKIPEGFFFDNNKKPVLFLPNKNGDPVPVKKIRLRESIGNAVNLKSDLNQWVNPYNNHHVVIYKSYNGELKEEVVSFWTVIERQQQGEPIYQLPIDGKEIISTIQENDMFLLALNENQIQEINLQDKEPLSKHLYRVQKISSMYYTFRHHLASTINNEKEEISIRSFGSWIKYNPIKVRIDNLGNLKLIK